MAWRLKAVTATQEIWQCDFYRELTRKVINNFAEFFQPFAQGQPQYLNNHKADLNKAIVIHMPQSEIMTAGFGQNINLLNFEVVEDFFWGLLNIDYGRYTFNDLRTLGIVNFPENAKAKDKPHKIQPSLYGQLWPGDIGIADAAFIYGTVGFTLLPTTVFTVSPEYSSVDGEIIVTPDNWDYNSDDRVIQFLNSTVKKVMGAGKHNIRRAIIIEYQGPGKRASMGLRVDVSTHAQPLPEYHRRKVRNMNRHPLPR